MRLWERYKRRVRVGAGHMTWFQRVLFAAMVVLVLLGSAALFVGSRRERMAPALDGVLSEAELAGALAALESMGIAARTESGRLLVSADRLRQARAILAEEGLLDADPASAFEELARAGDIWSSQAERAKRWQVAKMATLSRLIGAFPPVRSATVLVEPGTPQGLGRPAQEPRAAVHVALKAGARMTDKLAGAMADLVAGSVAGMKRESVQIIDSTGRSHAVPDTRPDAAPGTVDCDHVAEARHSEKLRAALQYVEGLVVTVDARDGALAATLSVPRSYLRRVHEAHRGEAGTPAEEFGPFVEAELARLGRAAAQVIGAADCASVQVDSFYDLPKPTAEAPQAEREAGGWFVLAAKSVVVLTSGLLIVAAGAFLLRTRSGRRPRRGSRARGGSPIDMHLSQRGMDDGAVAFLSELPAVEVAEVMRQEHPQAAAVILSRLEPAKAAAVLTNLPPHLQAEVIRRVVNLNRVDADVVATVDQMLAARLTARLTAGPAEPSSLGGVGRVGQILQHTSYSTEHRLLEMLGEEEPRLADRIRRRSVTFEDLAAVEPMQLRLALGQLTSRELATALRTAEEKVRRRVLSCLPTESAKQVRRQLEQTGPVRVCEIEAAQQRAVEAIRRLDAGDHVASRAPGAGRPA